MPRNITGRRVLLFIIVLQIAAVLYLYLHQKPAFTAADFYSTHRCSEAVGDYPKERCLHKNLLTILKEYGLPEAFSFLQYGFDLDPEIAAQCHALTHTLGTYAFRVFKNGTKLNLTPAISYCSFGFYHGFAESMLVSGNRVTEAEAFCRYVDTTLGAVARDASLQCWHGVGHGIVYIHDPAISADQEEIVKRALAQCLSVAKTPVEQSRCATGVFNGLAFQMVEGSRGLSIPADDPVAICKSQQGLWEDACYVSMNVVLLEKTNGDVEKASRYLTQIQNPEYARNAVINLVSPLGTQNRLSKNDDEGIALCRSLINRFHLPCIEGYAFGLMEHGRPLQEYERALKFCAVSALDPEEQSACFSYIFTYLRQWYSQSKTDSICSSIQPQFKQYCKDL